MRIPWPVTIVAVLVTAGIAVIGIIRGTLATVPTAGGAPSWWEFISGNALRVALPTFVVGACAWVVERNIQRSRRATEGHRGFDVVRRHDDGPPTPHQEHAMAAHVTHAIAGGGDGGGGNDDGPMEKMRDMFGPGHVDQIVRSAIQTCWMALPKDRRTVGEVEKEMRRLVDRAIANLREDLAAFGRPGEG